MLLDIIVSLWPSNILPLLLRGTFMWCIALHDFEVEKSKDIIRAKRIVKNIVDYFILLGSFMCGYVCCI